MRILVEGMDNTGKTTLVDKLSREIDHPTIHSPGPKDRHDLVEWMARFRDTRELIMDRCPAVSEMVYGKVLRGESKIGYSTATQFLDTFDLIIYCRPPAHRIERTLENRQQMDGVVREASPLLKAYDEFFLNLPDRFNDKVVVFDYTSDPDHFKILLDVWRRK